MDAAEFETGLVSLYGPNHRRPAAEAFGVDKTTIDRWCTAAGSPNHRAVHPTAAKLLEHLLDKERRRKVQRSYEKTYKTKARKEKAHG